MRTTVTLDPDVQELVDRSMRERGLSFKQVLNDALRSSLGSERKSTRPFRQKTFNMGIPLIDLTKANAIADEMEDEVLLRKFRQGR